ncbi:hypothetical protein IG631_23597 [Alternaria alternata]|nr:hypothetical protein IG631_23597 [Alternaria alternata]
MVTHGRERSARCSTRMPGLSGHRRSVSIMFTRHPGADAKVASIMASHRQTARAYT